MNNIFKKLSSKEKKLLLWGGVIIILALFWAWIYKPMNKSINAKSSQIQLLKNQLTVMQTKKPELLRFNSNTSIKRDSKMPFITWVDQQLNKKNLSKYLSRSEPNSDGSLTMTFENIIFNELILWLQPLVAVNSIQIKEADFNLLDRDMGIVNARLTLNE